MPRGAWRQPISGDVAAQQPIKSRLGDYNAAADANTGDLLLGASVVDGFDVQSERLSYLLHRITDSIHVLFSLAI